MSILDDLTESVTIEFLESHGFKWKQWQEYIKYVYIDYIDRADNKLSIPVKLTYDFESKTLRADTYILMLPPNIIFDDFNIKNPSKIDILSIVNGQLKSHIHERKNILRYGE